MSSRLICLCLAVVTFSSAGCTIPCFQHPLVPPEESKLPTDLLGAYEKPGEDGNPSIRVESAGDRFPAGFVRVTESRPAPDPSAKSPPESFVGFIHPQGESYIFHVPLTKTNQQEEFATGWKPELVIGYFLVRLRPTKDGFAVGHANSEFVINEIQKGRLPGTVEFHPTSNPNEVPVPKRIEVTASGQELKAFMARHAGNELFKDELVSLRRRPQAAADE